MWTLIPYTSYRAHIILVKHKKCLNAYNSGSMRPIEMKWLPFNIFKQIKCELLYLGLFSTSFYKFGSKWKLRTWTNIFFYYRVVYAHWIQQKTAHFNTFKRIKCKLLYLGLFSTHFYKFGSKWKLRTCTNIFFYYPVVYTHWIMFK